jgi:FXSXX-COOH protein
MTACPRDTAGGGTAGPREPLPDLLGLSLAELRRLDHPVLSEVLDELRARLVRQGETLWDFDQSPRPDRPNGKTG